MPALNTSALVLRHADYADYDRMVTLFSPDTGASTRWRGAAAGRNRRW